MFSVCLFCFRYLQNRTFTSTHWPKEIVADDINTSVISLQQDKHRSLARGKRNQALGEMEPGPGGKGTRPREKWHQAPRLHTPRSLGYLPPSPQNTKQRHCPPRSLSISSFPYRLTYPTLFWITARFDSVLGAGRVQEGRPGIHIRWSRPCVICAFSSRGGSCSGGRWDRKKGLRGRNRRPILREFLTKPTNQRRESGTQYDPIRS